MAQNNQGWRESDRFEHRNLQGNNWQDDNRSNNRAWRDDYNEDDNRDYRNRQREEDSFNERGRQQRSSREQHPYNNYQSSGPDMQGTDYRQYDRGNERNDRSQNGRRRYDWNNDNWMNNDRGQSWNDRSDSRNTGSYFSGNEGRQSDEQGYRNPAGGDTNRYQAGGYIQQSGSQQQYDSRQYGNRNWQGNESNRYGNQDTQRALHSGKGPKNYRRSDDRIHEDINDRLTYNEELDASSIEVQVAQGEVTLSGTVDSRSNKRLAEDLAEMVAGVQNVENRIRVQQDSGNRENSGAESNKDRSGEKSKRMTAEGSLQDNADRKTTKTV